MFFCSQGLRSKMEPEDRIKENLLHFDDDGVPVLPVWRCSKGTTIPLLEYIKTEFNNRYGKTWFAASFGKIGGVPSVTTRTFAPCARQLRTIVIT